MAYGNHIVPFYMYQYIFLVVEEDRSMLKMY